MQPANSPLPLTSWLVKRLIHRVRHVKCILLKSLLLYQLTSRGTFYLESIEEKFLKLGIINDQ